MRRRFGLAVMLGTLAAAILTAEQDRPAVCDPGNAGLQLPPGFCAAVVADGLGRARHMAISPRGDLYVALRREGDQPGGIVALRDGDRDGRFERQERFAPGMAGTGLEWRGDYLYFGADTRIVRFRITGDGLVPTDAPEVIVAGFPAERQHAAKPIAFGAGGEMYVTVGAPSNACQRDDRKAGSPGQRPCPILERHGGIWRYEADRPGQTHSPANRFATGIRHAVAIAWNTQHRALYALQHGRDQLHGMFPSLFTEKQSAELPAEEMLLVRDGSNFGWPYCYWDPFQNVRVLAPEYGGDGRKEGECAQYGSPIAAFPAHTGPNDLLFYTGAQFPEEYRGGAFVAFHGSWNRAPLPQAGYNVSFVPLYDEGRAGTARVFADGFAGRDSVEDPNDAAHRPTGLALAADGSVYVSDDQRGRIWRITYAGARRTDQEQ